jgi:hypothetical protein
VVKCAIDLLGAVGWAEDASRYMRHRPYSATAPSTTLRVIRHSRIVPSLGSLSSLPRFPAATAAFSFMIDIFVCSPHPRSGQTWRQSGRRAYKANSSGGCDWQSSAPAKTGPSPAALLPLSCRRIAGSRTGRDACGIPRSAGLNKPPSIQASLDRGSSRGRGNRGGSGLRRTAAGRRLIHRPYCPSCGQGSLGVPAESPIFR